MKTKTLKSLLFLFSFIFSVCIISIDKNAVATDLADANISALDGTREHDGVLCRGQLFKVCNYGRTKSCVYHLSPSYVCTMWGYELKETGTNPTNPSL